LNMIEKYFESEIPGEPANELRGSDLITLINDTPKKVDAAMQKLAFSEALSVIWALIGRANKYIEEQAPWKLAKDEGKKDELAAVMYNLAETLKSVAILVTPFMPETAKKMWEQLNFAVPLEKTKIEDASYNLGMKIAGTKVKKGNPLFPRLEKK
ncbi:MAG: class I tRNA ligase family protein, partial [Candidatus Saganbacteria bacterium]|nr:class I tRNA ligase family protein [Candidatus Saganbacteria bacterium]